ncbi:uncharacterized protein LOC117520992 [Thalassophryne amazonica]|uniref:uncharacterized protein LOC117520992 n=1 Tax=Thalassophryne amazonica TaxID=390379 RepID=UPI00147109A5|nr:uncharacterized protein LOC117520992 [Thalassophryne amazonica]
MPERCRRKTSRSAKTSQSDLNFHREITAITGCIPATDETERVGPAEPLSMSLTNLCDKASTEPDDSSIGPHEDGAKMTWFMTLLLFSTTVANSSPDVVEFGPESGIVLKDQPGLLITNCRLHTQRVFVRLDPTEVYRANFASSTVNLVSWAGSRWTKSVLKHAEADIVNTLCQMEKFTVTQAELSGLNKREKRFIGGLLKAASAVGSLFSFGLSAVNTVTLSTVKRHVSELQEREGLETIGQTVRDTVVILSTHTNVLKKTVSIIDQLTSVLQEDYAHTQMLNMLMADMTRDVEFSIDSLAVGRIRPYIVPLTLVHQILESATHSLVTPL